MGRPMAVGAWGVFDGDTSIEFVPGQGGVVELILGGPNGFTLLATDAGLARLADVIESARKDTRRLVFLEEADGEGRTGSS